MWQSSQVEGQTYYYYHCCVLLAAMSVVAGDKASEVSVTAAKARCWQRKARRYRW